MTGNRKDKNSVAESFAKPKKEAETVEYFTYKGKGDWIDENNQPRLNKNSELCCAFRSGSKLELRLSDNGEFVNPNGLPQRHRSDRFVPVTAKCFDLYLTYLRTGVEKYLIQAKREV